MDQQHLFTVRGPRFWSIMAAIAGAGTLSTLLSELLPIQSITKLGVPLEFVQYSTLATYMSALACSFVGFFSMLLMGVLETGRIVIRGRLLSRYAMASFCIPLYLAPWLYLLLSLFVFGVVV
jgi:hypothetical protein